MGSISHIDHIAIAVSSISQVRAFYEDALGLKISYVEDLPKRGIKTAFIEIGPTKIELIEPLHESSEISKFLKNRGPGLHHIAFKTDDITAMQTQIESCGAKLTYAQAQPGSHNTLVNFIHPKSSGGVLVELVK